MSFTTTIAHHKAIRLDILTAQVFCAPIPDGGEDGHEGAAQVRHGVFAPGRDLGVDGPGDETVIFQLPELERQHPGSGGDSLLKLRKAQGPGGEVPEDQGLVLSADEAQGGFDGADLV